MSSESQSLVVFMKILDPSGRMNDPNPKRALRRRHWLRRELLGGKDIAKLYEKSYRHIGSTVVLSVPLASQANVPRPVGLAFHTILSLVHGLAALSLRHVHLGGVMSLGVTHVGLDAVHGPGVIGAQRIHDMLPSYPRIVIDPHLLRSIEQVPLLRAHHVDEEMRHVKGLLMRDSDGLWCIDYLGAMASEVDDEQGYIAFMSDHKRSVEASAARTRNLDTAAMAMNWLATYHDRVIERMSEEGLLAQDNIAALRISVDLPLRFSF